jgi:cytochrome b subunit of formate dehydrogenase
MPCGFIAVVSQIGLWPELQNAFLLHPLVNSAMFLAAYSVFAYMFFHFARDQFRNETD